MIEVLILLSAVMLLNATWYLVQYKKGRNMMKRFIFVTMQQEFIHRYPDAPAEVAYLREYHRHIAHIKVEIEVYHNERELEFIMVKHKLEKFVAGYVRVNSDKSCESIAESIIEYVKDTYGPSRAITVTVAEDGENGCTLICKPEI